VDLYALSLLIDTLPDDALRILKSSLRFADPADRRLDLLDNLQRKMLRYASNFHSPTGNSIPATGFCYKARCNDFINSLRELLRGLKSRIDLTNLSLKPLTDPSIHENLAGACKQAGISAEHGFCEIVKISESGRARAGKSHILRLTKGEVLIEFSDNGDSFHLFRVLAMSRKESAVLKLKTFSEMLNILFRTVKKVTARSASYDDLTVKMGACGDWRFEIEQSIWGFEFSRLNRFWLRAGAIPERLLNPKSDVLVFLRKDYALEFLEKFREGCPDSPSPWFYASRFGIYSPDLLIRLRG